MIRLQKRGKRGELMIYGLIGVEVNTADVVRQLEAMRDVDQIDVWIASDGGHATDGLAIYNSLLRHPARIVTYVDFALSIASVIAMSGEERHIASNGWFMVHNSWYERVSGDHNDLRRKADHLEAVTEHALTAYLKRISLSREETTQLMEDETWIDARRALEIGLVTHIDELEAAAAAFDLSRYEHPPAAALQLIARKESTMPKPEGGATPPQTGTQPTDPPAQPPATEPTPAQLTAQLAADRAALTAERAALQADREGLRADRLAARMERAENRVEKDLAALGTRVTPAMLNGGLRATLVHLAAAEQPLMVKVPKPGSTTGETEEVSAYDAQLRVLRQLPENKALTSEGLANEDDPAAVFGDGRPEHVARMHERAGLTPERLAELQSKYGPF